MLPTQRRQRQWHPTPVLLPGESHGQRSLVGCSPWGCRVRHNWATSLSLFTFTHWRRKCNPLQYSCLENPRDGGAWWAAVCEVTQSQTRLKWLSSSSSLVNLDFSILQLISLYLRIFCAKYHCRWKDVQSSMLISKHISSILGDKYLNS